MFHVSTPERSTVPKCSLKVSHQMWEVLECKRKTGMDVQSSLKARDLEVQIDGQEFSLDLEGLSTHTFSLHLSTQIGIRARHENPLDFVLISGRDILDRLSNTHNVLDKAGTLHLEVTTKPKKNFFARRTVEEWTATFQPRDSSSRVQKSLYQMFTSLFFTPAESVT